MIYITGDKHAEFDSVYRFCEEQKTSLEDIMIILGDAGINYYTDYRAYELKANLAECMITFFCIHGNHEERPENISTYITKEFHGGLVYYEEEFPNILFAKDGEIYNFDDKEVLVIGGAYSVDKYYRLARGYNWYESEQPTEEIKNKVRDVLEKRNNKIHVILSHTCPYKYLPYEVFLPFIDQSSVDQSTEKFLDEIEDTTTYEKWYCGHYHTDKTVDKVRLMFHDIKVFE